MHPGETIVSANPQGSVRCLSQGFDEVLCAVLLDELGKVHAVVAEQAGRGADPDESSVVLQQSVDFGVFQAIDVAEILEPVALS